VDSNYDPLAVLRGVDKEVLRPILAEWRIDLNVVANAPD
jgi:hypothetical protein